MTQKKKEPGLTPTRAYALRLSEERVEELYQQLMTEIALKKRFKEPGLTARQLAKDLHCGVCYISAVMERKFNDTFVGVVSEYRVRQAMLMMKNSGKRLSMEQIWMNCGFKSRQSFYNAFNRVSHLTPASYYEQVRPLTDSKKQNNKNR